MKKYLLLSLLFVPVLSCANAERALTYDDIRRITPIQIDKNLDTEAYCRAALTLWAPNLSPDQISQMDLREVTNKLYELTRIYRRYYQNRVDPHTGLQVDLHTLVEKQKLYEKMGDDYEECANRP